MDVVAILKRAKEIVAAGWIQNVSQNESGTHVCAAQAIGVAAQEQHQQGEQLTSDWLDEPGRILLTAALDRTNRVWPSIPAWNDYPSRNQDEVLDTFDHAIKLAETQAPQVSQPMKGK